MKGMVLFVVSLLTTSLGLASQNGFEMEAEQWEYQGRIGGAKQIDSYQFKISGEEMVAPAFSAGDSLIRAHKGTTMIAEMRRVFDRRAMSAFAGLERTSASSENHFARTGQSQSAYGGLSFPAGKGFARLSLGYEELSYPEESFAGPRIGFAYERPLFGGYVHIDAHESQAYKSHAIGFLYPTTACTKLGTRYEKVNGRHGLADTTFLMLNVYHSFGVGGHCKERKRKEPLSLDSYLKTPFAGKAILVK